MGTSRSSRGRPRSGASPGALRRTDVHPLGYHHILHKDRTLLYFLDRIGALDSVRWRRIRMLFRLGDRACNLSHPADFLALPMSLRDKASFARLMVSAFFKDDWSAWSGRLWPTCWRRARRPAYGARSSSPSRS